MTVVTRDQMKRDAQHVLDNDRHEAIPNTLAIHCLFLLSELERLERRIQRNCGGADRVTSLGTIPRRLVECGGAVEELGGLWHIARDGSVTYCGEDCRDWPRVALAVERSGIWCGICLMTAAEECGAPEMQEPPLCRCVQDHHTCGHQEAE